MVSENRSGEKPLGSGKSIGVGVGTKISKVKTKITLQKFLRDCGGVVEPGPPLVWAFEIQLL